MKILLTGGAGFVGHHVLEYFLKNTDHEIVVIDRLDTSGNLNRIDDILKKDSTFKTRVKILWHDLKSSLNDYLIKQIGDVQYILHLAAGSHVDRSIENPLEFVYDNVVGTANLLDFARLHLKDKLKLFLYFSTDEVFGPAPEGVFYKENDRYNSGNPYSATKAGAEELCVAYENTYKMPIVITHTMNVYGIRQHSEKFVPKVIKSLLTQEKIYIHADKTCTKPGTRHYIHASDVASAVLFLMSNFVSGQKYNIVGNREVSNLDLALEISNIMNRKLNYELVDFHSSRPGHDLRYALCGEKMKQLGWEPKLELRNGLEEVISWYTSNQGWL
jgi:dTDP-glucose 4,6-dehydratase